MRVRVKFAKYGPMKFIGHLELMRYLQSAVRRTEIPIKYDEGMHQRMVMSFAMPLGVGPISSAEYMDIELEAPISTEKAMQQLGEHMCEGLDILDFREVDGGKRMKAMTIVAAADYEVWFREGFTPDWDWKVGLESRIERILQQGEHPLDQRDQERHQGSRYEKLDLRLGDSRDLACRYGAPNCRSGDPVCKRGNFCLPPPLLQCWRQFKTGTTLWRDVPVIWA